MKKLIILFSFMFFGWSSSALQVENFVLLDQQGNAHELYYYSDAKAIVLMVQGNACTLVRNAVIDLKAIREEYQAQGVEFLMINSNIQDNRESIQAEANEWEIDLPILVDDGQLVGDSLNLTRTAEVLVIDPTNWELVYRGPLNDRLVYERQKNEASNHYVKSVLDSVLTGTNIDVASQTVMGCLINFPHRNEQNAEQITYIEDVAPILQENCVSCHTVGGIGPWPMNSFEMVRGFAPMMREVLMTKRMPPWHADPHVGVWENDRSLSLADRQTLVRWVEGGTVRGEGDDPLKSIEPLTAGGTWKYGEPDLIVKVPPFTVPASGVVDYQYHTIEADLDESVWIKGFEVIPGNMNVVHHLLMGTVSAERPSSNGIFENYIGGYAPGAGYALLPEGTGIRVDGNSHFQVQMHYTPYGKEVVDETLVGIYLHDEQPETYLRHGVVISTQIEIPPNTKAHTESAYYLFEDDATLYQVLPHSHYRGSASTFSLIYPDGTKELLLSVPNYDFNWQTGYVFETPLDVPKGAKLVHTTTYDNSEQNLGNPDPDATVTWGLQSWEEMLFGDFTFTWKNETSENPIHDRRRTTIIQMLGMLDKDMSGGLAKSELSGTGRRSQAYLAYFDQSDEDASGELNVNEIIRMNRLLARDAMQRRANAGRGGSGE